MSSPGTEALDRILPKLQDVQPEGSSGRSWLALCPAHADHKPSLLVTLKDDGKLLMVCRSRKCPTKDVVGALGLTLKDLFPRRERSMESRIDRTYDYHDASGRLIFQVVRLRDPKDFRQRSASGEWKVKNLPKVPYRYHELVGAPINATVYVVEGEKDADSLSKLGFVATTNPGGANKWGMLNKSAVKRALTGRTVVVLPDNDEAGELHAIDVGTRLKGIAASVKVLKLPNLPDKGDVSDWIAAGGTAEKLIELSAMAADPGPPPPVTVTAASRPGGRPLTDYGNAQRLIDLHGNDVRFLATVGRWYVWDGKRFRDDELNRIQELAKDTIRNIYVEAGQATNDIARKMILDHAKSSESARAITVVPKLASSEKSVVVGLDDWDANPVLLNCENGTVDLRTGVRREHDRADRITKMAPVEYDPKAKCPTWEAMLRSIFPADEKKPELGGNEKLIAYVQRLFGNAATGHYQTTVPIFYGAGANGKSTLLNAVLDVLGPDYSMQAPHGFLMEKRNEGHPTETADLYGKRLVAVTETGSGRKIDAALVKSLTGGEPIRSRRMRTDFFQFTPTHMAVLCTNHRPRISDTDDGIWRRVSLIPFAVKFWNPDRGEVGPDTFRQDKSLAEKLKRERAGILAWIVRGAVAWFKDGLNEPDEVRAQTEEYRNEENVIGRFLGECVTNAGRESKVALADLYKTYVEWCDENGERHWSTKVLAAELRKIGYEIDRSTGGKMVCRGIWVPGKATTLDDLVPD